MKNQTLIIIVLMFACVAGVVYLFKDKLMALFQKSTPPLGYTAPSEAPTSNGGNAGGNNTIYEPTPVPNIATLDQNKILKKGSKGNEVIYLQNMINGVLSLQNKQQLVCDGDFGAKTENALYYLAKVKQITIAQASSMLFMLLGK